MNFPAEWPVAHPERIQAYSAPTGNGTKVTIALEEIELPYELHCIDLKAGGTSYPGLMALNPNAKIPTILDPQGPDGKACVLFESGAILLYLAEKTGQLLPKSGVARYQAMQWLMWNVAGIGPNVGGMGFFHKFAGKAVLDQRPLERHVNELKRLLSVLDQQLSRNEWIAGKEYSIADISTFPVIHFISSYFEADQLIGMNEFRHVLRTLNRFLERPAVQRGFSALEKNNNSHHC